MREKVLITFLVVVLCGLSYADFEQPDRAYYERMAAFHETLVRFDEVVPNAAVMTYHTGITEIFMAGMLSSSVETQDGFIGPEDAKDLKVEDFPGGVEATYMLGDVKVTVRYVPLILGRDTKEKDGAAVYSIRTEPATPIVIRCRGGKHFPNTLELIQGFMRSGDMFVNPANAIDLQDGFVTFEDPNMPILTAISTKGGEVTKGESSSDPYIDIRYPQGSTNVLLVFAGDKGRAAELLQLDSKRELKKVNDYYEELLASKIETPETLLNEAFRSAIYNLEYNYQKPYGWVECINHWMPIWHQQHTRAAEWLGQEDRSRLTTQSQAERIQPGNQMPNILNDGTGVTTFGGTNQFWSWQLRHYIKFTDDVEFVKEMIPYMDRALQGTLDRDDPDNNGLFAWGFQIGNQEDFITTPHDGTVPTIEAINMMLTRAEMAELVGDTETAEYWRSRARKSRVQLKKKLWLRDLGRFGYFYDATDMMRLDGAYQAYLYPAIWDSVDPLDQYTGVRHVTDRLMGSGGEIYCSNNFSVHYYGTWGMQAGCAQQPWGAWGFSKMGMRNQAYRPLKAAAQWAMDINHRGSWPEVCFEPIPAYFSPPAGLYIASMVEAIFGLKPDAPNGTLEISPAFPDHWPSAKLNLPKFQVKYEHQGNRSVYRLNTKKSFAHQIRWKLPVCTIDSFKVNGKKCKFTIVPGIDYVELQAALPAAKHITLEIEYKKIDYTLIAPKSIAQGDRFTVALHGANLIDVIDRSGLLSQCHYDASVVKATLQDDLLDAYLPYGRLGLLNFSRRTVFLECESQEVRFWLPVDFAVLPRFEVHGEIKDSRIEMQVRNNTFADFEGEATLNLENEFVDVDLELKARSEKTVYVPLDENLASHLSVGDNSLTLVFNESKKAEFILCMKENPASDSAELVSLVLDESAMITDTNWTTLRNLQGAPHTFFVWPEWNQPLASLEGKSELAISEIPGLTFDIHGRNMMPVSPRTAQPMYRHELEEGLYCKFYILILPLIDNHDMFSEVARVTVHRGEHCVYTRTLRYPGDMDYFDPHQNFIGGTVRGRKTRYGLLPQLSPQQGDWIEGKPGQPLLSHTYSADRPEPFPQSEFWSRSVPVTLESGTLTVIECDLAQPVKADRLTFACLGEYAAFGILGIVAQTMPDPSVRVIFDAKAEDALEGWTIEGNAFSIAAVPGLFKAATLNSLAAQGETVTGKAVSPQFRIEDNDHWLRMEVQGGDNRSCEAKAKQAIRIIDCDTQEVLAEVELPASHLLTSKEIDISEWRNRTVRLLLIDNNTNTSYAWVGLKTASITRIKK